MSINGEHEPGREELEERRRQMRSKRADSELAAHDESMKRQSRDAENARIVEAELKEYARSVVAEEAVDAAGRARSSLAMERIDRDLSSVSERQAEAERLAARGPLTIGAPTDAGSFAGWSSYAMIAVGSFLGGLLFGLWLKDKFL